MLNLMSAVVLDSVVAGHRIHGVACHLPSLLSSYVVGNRIHGVEYHLRHFCRHQCYLDVDRHCPIERLGRICE